MEGLNKNLFSNNKIISNLKDLLLEVETKIVTDDYLVTGINTPLDTMSIAL